MVNVDELMSELHIDDTPEEKANVQAILNDAVALIDEDCGTPETLDALHNDKIYAYCVKTTFYRMYINRADDLPTTNRLTMWKKKLQIKYGDDDNPS